MIKQQSSRIFSGIQPTGGLHLGNYLGAIRNWVDLQVKTESLFCIVDLHAITVPHEPSALRENTRAVVACLLASGIDPEKSVLFNQSSVPQHSQLAWILTCVARLGWLNRMTQFKEKAGKRRENASVGLYSYPLLMAADILLYRATHVPVGEDQKQHLELTRDIAQAFNTATETSFFPLPEPVILGSGTRVMSLRDGSKKMSKSDLSDHSRINMTDDPDTIATKIQKAKTDSEVLPSEISGLEDRLEAKNLLEIYAALDGANLEDVIRTFGGVGFAKFKSDFTELVVSKLGPISSLTREYLEHPDEIDKILARGTDRAEVIAADCIRRVNDLFGFLNTARETS